MIIIFICLFALSFIGNGLLAFFLFKKAPLAKKAEMTYDARSLLLDLASGPALIKVEYLDRSEVLLRSPRHL